MVGVFALRCGLRRGGPARLCVPTTVRFTWPVVEMKQDFVLDEMMVFSDTIVYRVHSEARCQVLLCLQRKGRMKEDSRTAGRLIAACPVRLYSIVFPYLRTRTASGKKREKEVVEREGVVDAYGCCAAVNGNGWRDASMHHGGWVVA